ncbi:hypothetical protein GPL15_15425 [Clostridium sp. MCC353]|uniref:hypothetical protein n=1 Tax=Clostridium sp. MCC353 TaxID=2592646 RepID=UPI001C01EAE9|nr:hypothetical protein [Clostridium sp. MCC353]MBT9777892.1 hypothetical protein [Clostridium sp. MCC353]
MLRVLEQGIRILIKTCRKLGRTREETQNELEESYALSSKDAKKYLDQCWD